LLYQLKHRDAGKPIAWLVADETALDTFGADVPAYAHALAHAFWPGGLTLIVKAGPTVPEAFRAEAGTIGLRCPNDPITLELIERVGGPLATTSANLSGHSASRTFSAIDSELLSQVPYAIEDDAVKSGIASTIVDCTGDTPTILREGAIDLPAIEAVIAG
jgi:L-threonylcarbamoyladenylate synthase